jgi:hypothetical protein
MKCPEENLGWRACDRGFNLSIKGLSGKFLKRVILMKWENFGAFLS